MKKQAMRRIINLLAVVAIVFLAVGALPAARPPSREDCKLYVHEKGDSNQIWGARTADNMLWFSKLLSSRPLRPNEKTPNKKVLPQLSTSWFQFNSARFGGGLLTIQVERNPPYYLVPDFSTVPPRIVLQAEEPTTRLWSFDSEDAKGNAIEDPNVGYLGVVDDKGKQWWLSLDSDRRIYPTVLHDGVQEVADYCQAILTDKKQDQLVYDLIGKQSK